MASRFAWCAVFVAVLALIASPALGARSKRRKARKPWRPGKVLVLGSSSMNGSFGDEIVRGLKRLGYTVDKRGKSSSGFARPDYHDWHAEIRSLPIDKNTTGAVIYLGTNDAQALHLRPAERRKLRRKRKWLPWKHRAWIPTYASRVSAFARALCKRGVHRVAVITPVDVVKPRLRARLQKVRTALARGARPVPCSRAFTGRGDLRRILGEQRRARQAKLRKSRKRKSKARRPPPKRLRQPDGTHLTREGSRRAWKRVERKVNKWFKRGPVPKRRSHKSRRKKGRRNKVRGR